MFQKTSGCLMLVGWVPLFLLLFMPMPVAAITIPPTHCIDAGCDDPVGKKDPPPNAYEPPSYTPGPSPEEQKRQQDEKAAYDANNKGIEFYNAGDLENAIAYFGEAIKYSPGNQTYRDNLQLAQKWSREVRAKQKAFDEKKAEGLARLKNGSSGFKSNAFEEAQSNLFHTQQEGKPGSVFDTRDDKKSVPLVPVETVQISERVRNNPKIIKAQKELKNIQAKNQKLNKELTQLIKDRNSATDPKTIPQLTRKINEVDKNYNKNKLEEYRINEEIKLFTTSEANAPVSSGKSSKEGGK